jgi:hypothetical protein
MQREVDAGRRLDRADRVVPVAAVDDRKRLAFSQPQPDVLASGQRQLLQRRLGQGLQRWLLGDSLADRRAAKRQQPRALGVLAQPAGVVQGIQQPMGGRLGQSEGSCQVAEPGGLVDAHLLDDAQCGQHALRRFLHVGTFLSSRRHLNGPVL